MDHRNPNHGDGQNPAGGPGEEGSKLPDVLPILPLRGIVVYPETAVPLTVGQARSIKLVDDVVSTSKILTASASDARMAGLPYPAMASGGSGNQGIVASLVPYTVG